MANYEGDSAFYVLADGHVEGYDNEQEARTAASTRVVMHSQKAIVLKRLTIFQRTFTTDEPQQR